MAPFFQTAKRLFTAAAALFVGFSNLLANGLWGALAFLLVPGMWLGFFDLRHLSVVQLAVSALLVVSAAAGARALYRRTKLRALIFAAAAAVFAFAPTFAASPSEKYGALALAVIAVVVTVYSLLVKNPAELLDRITKRRRGTHRTAGSHWTAAGEPKRSYRSRAEADEVSKRQSHQTGELMNPYQCTTCRRWHVGHARR